MTVHIDKMMMKDNTTDPVAVCYFHCIGIEDAGKRKVSAALCGFLTNKLKIPADR